MTEINVKNEIDIIEERVMSKLKDFQLSTVNRIEQLYQSGQKRILVSDEVGLGKTMIARGTIAKLARMQKDANKSLFKVVYICSNASIAEQNLNKLRISRSLKTDSINSSRLSMQHLNIFNQENDSDTINRFIQLIPLTPDTSFNITRGAGTYEERALIFAILSRLPEFTQHIKALYYALSNGATESWYPAVCKYNYEVDRCDERSDGSYLSYMLDMVSRELQKPMEDNISLLSTMLEMCNTMEKYDYEAMPSQYASIISKLRIIFAKISLERLEPDLVIMDEFQRFKYLIKSDPQSETGMLKSKFFESEKLRILLLSATPYKMYSTLEEIDEAQVDEHYSEFFEVMNFLNITEKDKNDFKTIWSNYSIQLKELTKGNATLISAKDNAENAMYQHICRTERISSTESADIIDDKDTHLPIRVMEQDIKAYMELQKLLEDIGAGYNVPIDYVKSCPYLLSFMKDYKLKKNIERYFKNNQDQLRKLNKDTFWLKKNTLNNYGKIPTENARLDRVMSHIFKDKAELLLWVPPSKPYYPPQGKFKDVQAFSKTLIFSSWEMVPRMLAVLLSYEAERRTIGKLANDNNAKDASYFYSGEKRYPSSRLNFALKDGAARAMSLFCLMYPSKFLAECYNPIEYLNKGSTLKDIERDIKGKLKSKLSKYDSPKTGMPDQRWYYMAPLLLDGAGYVTRWLNERENLISSNDEDFNDSRQKGFKAHIAALDKLYYDNNCGRKCILGKMPDDLLDVLTDMAIASPAICIFRTYNRYCSKNKDVPLTFPSQIAKIFINRMNTPEATAAVELACGQKSEDAHWQNLLTYCKQGNIQAMFDEYAHIISNGLDDNDSMVEHIHNTVSKSMDIRTTIYSVDTFNSFKARVSHGEEKSTNMRSHFAVAFTKGDGKDKDADRKKVVRNSFNSPFRPFVLASTSIGQEGLDFHNYCRRIVHWNLPSNPIDLEQREGRINRFECLAIRQNIAKRYGDITFNSDIWNEMFDTATRLERGGKDSDLIPYWGLTNTEDMIKIERIVPMYPFSRDVISYERLIKILSLYRLTLGQARQEELLEYIFKNQEKINDEDLRALFINLSPYYKDSSRDS